MALHSDFPSDRHVLLEPTISWYPGEEVFTDTGHATLLPPLVYEVRRGVKAWRERSYTGANDTTRALLHQWFDTEQLLPSIDGALRPYKN